MNEIYQTADLWGVLRTICIVLIVIHLLKFIARMLAPFLMKKFSQKMQQKAEEQLNQRGFNTSSRAQKPEGTVTIEKKTNNSSNQKSTEDDFVDYEIVE